MLQENFAFTSSNTFNANNDNLTGVADFQVFNEQGLVCMPNPANDVLKIYKRDYMDESVQIWSMTGTLMYEGTINSSLNVNVGNWNKGLYIVKTETNTVKVAVQ